MKNIVAILCIITSLSACKKFIKLTPITEIQFLNPKDSLLVGLQDTLTQQISVVTGEPNNSVNFTFLFFVNSQIQQADQILFSMSNPSLASIQDIEGEIILKTFQTGVLTITAYAKSNPNVSNSYVLKIYDKDILIQDNSLRKALFNKGIAIDLNTGIMKLSSALADSTLLDISGQGITSLNGLEVFANLKGLNCSNNNISDLSVIKNMPNITQLNCSQNPLLSLDIDQNNLLQSLICNSNNLTQLNLTKAPSLVYLICSNNLLASLDINKNNALQVLDCSSNQLSNLSVTDNRNLKNLNCTQNNNISVLLTTTQHKNYVLSSPPLFIGATTWIQR